MGCNIQFLPGLGTSDPSDIPVLIVGHLDNLKKVQWTDIKSRMGKVNSTVWNSAIKVLRPNPTDSCALGLNTPVVGAYSQLLSRHNTPTGAHHVFKLIKSCLRNKSATESVIIVCKQSEVFACGCAVGRAFPTFSMRTDRHQKMLQGRNIVVEFVIVSDAEDNYYLNEAMANCLQDATQSIRLAAKIVDMPCNLMHTDAFLDEIRAVGAELNIEPMIIQGEELNAKGFGGIYGVGKAAIHQPALAVLSHLPEGATQTIAWCGKGIVYDTGGLSIKGKTAMPGMKRDCGGAAAILGAFQATVKRGFKENLHAVFCLAENAVGPISARPDDIHTLYSGHTVEINNTDAEGRLVLGDGVAYASKDLKADIVLDMATLTGAQGISTGKHHGAVLTNQEDWEEASVQAGKNSGDLLHPIVYCPELHFQEFNSAVADMKNSVADRGNAQSSCAGLFIGSHLQGGFFFKGAWIHIDMASPVHSGERATGYGVALLLSLFGQASEDKLLNLTSPLAIQAQSGNGETINSGANMHKRRRLI